MKETFAKFVSDKVLAIDAATGGCAVDGGLEAFTVLFEAEGFSAVAS